MRQNCGKIDDGVVNILKVIESATLGLFACERCCDLGELEISVNQPFHLAAGHGVDCHSCLQRVKISARPRTANPAPAQLLALGLCPVRSHKSGRMITGEVADSVAMIPVCEPCSA